VQLEVALPGWLPPLEALMSASVEADLQALGWSEEGGEEHVQVELVPSLERKATLLRIERRKWSNDPATLHGFLGRIADLATHLNEAAWQTRLKEVGLELAVVGQPQLDGFVYGIEVGVRQGASRRARSVSEAYNLVFARVIGPKGLHIVHADDGPRGEGLAVGHPFAESLLSIQGEDEEGIQALFQEERFVDALLPIVHQHRGSVVTDHEIRCRVPVTSSQDLVEIVEAVVQLATLIRPHGLKGIGLEPAGESEAKARPGREMEREPKG